MTKAEIIPLVNLVADGIRVFRTRDGKPITDEECEERARNLVESLRAEYIFIPRPEMLPACFEMRHLPGCRCVKCQQEMQ